MGLKEILESDDLLLRLVCLMVVAGFIIVSIIRAIRGDRDE